MPTAAGRAVRGRRSGPSRRRGPAAAPGPSRPAPSSTCRSRFRRRRRACGPAPSVVADAGDHVALAARRLARGSRPCRSATSSSGASGRAAPFGRASSPPRARVVAMAGGRVALQPFRHDMRVRAEEQRQHRQLRRRRSAACRPRSPSAWPDRARSPRHRCPRPSSGR